MKQFYTKFTTIFLSLLIAKLSYAQLYIIEGKITDKVTQEPINFANVFVKDSVTMGTTADYDGVYHLELEYKPDSLAVSALSYPTTVKKINFATNKITLNFEIERKEFSLSEVVIKPGINPAIRIIKNTIANKKRYDKDQLAAYGYEVYNKMEIDLDELTDKFQNRKIFKPFKEVFTNIDSTSEEKPFLPFFLSETLSDFYYQKNPIDKREIIKASKISGVSSENLSQFVGGMYVAVNVNDDWISLFQRQILSPFANGALLSYRYYLIDSAMIDGRWCYKIQFIPKRKGELTFEGDMWIADSVFAVKQLNMQLSKGADINFVRKLQIFTEATEVSPNVWMPDKEKLIVHFIKPQKGPGLIGRKSTSYKNFITNFKQPQLDSLFKKQKKDIVVKEGAATIADSLWNQYRHDTLSANEGRIYGMVDSLKNLPVVKTYTKLIQTIAIGYLDVGPISFGNIWNYINWSDVESWRFQFGMGTSNKFSKHVMLNAYMGYGIKDKRIKYGAEMLWLLKKTPRESIQLTYKDDIVSTSNFDQFYNAGILSNIAVRRWENGRKIPMKMMYIKEAKIDYYKEFDVGYSFKIGLVHRSLKPAGILDSEFLTAENARTPNQLIRNFKQFEISVLQRFAWQEKFLSGEFFRTSLGSEYPILYLQYSLGLRDVLGSDFNYHRLQFGISDYQPCGPLGKLFWQVEVGKTFGVLPFQLLHSANTSESYIYNTRGFNLLQMYEMAADRQLSLTLNQHFGGILFNRIPGVQKLKLREVFTFRMLWGDMTAKNTTANYHNYIGNPLSTANIRFFVPDKLPYMEAGIGIENILKIFRIDAIWRVTHLHGSNPFSIYKGNFGIRAGLELKF